MMGPILFPRFFLVTGQEKTIYGLREEGEHGRLTQGKVGEPVCPPGPSPAPRPGGKTWSRKQKQEQQP